jgi:DNA modification methylase
MATFLGYETLRLDELIPFPGNARRGDVEKIRASVRAHDQYRSLVVRRTPGGDVILAGNHTAQALIAEGRGDARCEVLECSESDAIKINLMDNKAADDATNDDDALSKLLAELDGDYEGTGYDDDEAAAILAGLAEDDLPPVIEVEERDLDEVDTTPIEPVTKPGDVWQLGDHRIICGDCRDDNTVAKLLGDRRINLAFTSPPYASQRAYDESSGFKPIPEDEYVEWFRDVATNVAAHLAEDGSWFVNIKPSSQDLDTNLYVMDLVIAHVREWGWHFGTEYTWERIGVPKNVTLRFKNQFEPIYQFAMNRWKMRPENVRHASDNVPVPLGPGAGDTGWSTSPGWGFTDERRPGYDRHHKGQGGDDSRGGKDNLPANGTAPGMAYPGNRLPTFGARKRANGTSKFMSDVQGVNHGVGEFIAPGLAYPGNRLPTFSGSHEATGHTAAFPVGLPAWFMRAYTDPGDVVYDPFMGSGSTLIAAQQEGRTAFGCEISTSYVDICLRRWQRVTGELPVLESTGVAHDFTVGLG